MKKLLVAPLLLSSYLVAQDIQLQDGWNFVSIVEDVNYTKTDLMNDLGSSVKNIVGFNGTQTVLASGITNLEANKAYWINVSGTASFSISGNTSKASLVTGWNAVGFSETDSLAAWITSMADSGYTVSNIIGFNGTQTLLSSSITSVEAGKGYWVKVSDISGSDSVSAPTGVDSDSTPPLVPSL